MSAPPELDSLTCPLNGFHLVEAAAGTGKTYNIQNLFARLVLERGIPVDQILVVTFTNAAAAELRDRIRTVLYRLRSPAAGSREEKLLAAVRRAGVSTQEIAERLRGALLEFDDAEIGTIHGFCLKVLTEHAFAGNMLFDCKLEQEVSGRILALAREFCRRVFYRSEYGALRMLLYDDSFSPENVARLAGRKIGNRELVLHTGTAPSGSTTEELLAFLAERLTALAASEMPPPEAWIDIDALLKKESRTAERAELLRRFRETGEIVPGMRDALTMLAPARLIEGISRITEAKRGRVEAFLRTAPEFFGRLTEIAAGIGGFAPVFKREAAAEIAAAFDAEKCRDHIQTFSDLPLKVYDGLRAGGALCAALRARYQAGIIDEFQDTNAMQYGIFTGIFRREGEPPLFLVGDPRQAIYSFQGGDISAYRDARRDISVHGGIRSTLQTNFRSAGNMVEAVNVLFAEHADPFADPEIPFPPVSAHAGGDGLPAPGALYGGAEAPSPLSIVGMNTSDTQTLCRTAAEQILAMLLDPSWKIPEEPDGESGAGRPPRPLRPGDFAVLMFENHELSVMKEALSRLGIPAVLTRTGNVFDSEEAKELRTVLEAVAAPLNTDRMIRALATSFCGVPLPELIALHTEAGNAEFLERRQTFADLHACWTEGSFLEMFNRLLEKFQVRSRCAALPGGERKLTDFLQLGDLLHKESCRAPSPQALLEFLRSAHEDSAESEQLLETDRDAVKLMTIHRSKGLEFPVVFLPNPASRDADKITRNERKRGSYHREDGSMGFDLTGDGELAARARTETFQELIRLLYVAVTRSKYRCVMLLPETAASPWNAAGWLLGRRAGGTPGEMPQIAVPEALQGKLLPVPEACYVPGALPPLCEDVPCPALAMEKNWCIASYSRLTPHPAADRWFDYDEEEPDEGEEPSESDAVFAFPGGAATGNAWHNILEKIDFSATEEEISRLTRSSLRTFGLTDGSERDGERVRLTCDVIRNVLAAPLRDDGGTLFSLNSVPRDDRLSELEFLCRFRHGFDAGDLRGVLAEYARRRFALTEWPEWSAEIGGGFLTGFIDLVFRHHGRYFIVDWKSNRLGGRLRNFDPDRLDGAMRDSFYFLQYLIYTVALVKYLRLTLGTFGEREYETMFGGVYYLFLRGFADARSGRGVFYEKPPFELVRQLEEVIG